MGKVIQIKQQKYIQLRVLFHIIAKSWIIIRISYIIQCMLKQIGLVKRPFHFILSHEIDFEQMKSHQLNYGD